MVGKFIEVGAFFPSDYTFIIQKYTHFIAQLYPHRIALIMRGPYRVHTHFFELFKARFYSGIILCSAEHSEIGMKTHTVQLDILTVKEKALVRIGLDRAETESTGIGVCDLAVRYDLGFHGIKVGRIKLPKRSVCYRKLLRIGHDCTRSDCDGRAFRGRNRISVAIEHCLLYGCAFVDIIIVSNLGLDRCLACSVGIYVCTAVVYAKLIGNSQPYVALYAGAGIPPCVGVYIINFDRNTVRCVAEIQKLGYINIKGGISCRVISGFLTVYINSGILLHTVKAQGHFFPAL